ncbi:hypothetical protein HY212_03385 [Candidatus Pacearchaeota archaeon]|nr:hypothetical protein [Candidatus Pacearchaeota archaeon]
MEENIFLYGKSYYIDRPRPQEQGDIIIYQEVNPNEGRAIGSLEGIFVSGVNPTKIFPTGQNRSVVRGEMDQFAEEYGGRFIPFEDGVIRLTRESVGEAAFRVNNFSRGDVPFKVGESDA